MSRKHLQLGIAIGTHSVTAVTRGSIAVTASVAWTMPDALEDVGGALSPAFAQLAERIQAATGRRADSADVMIALLPPLADARLVLLPPVRKAEALAVIQRDAACHFVGASVARTVAVRTPPKLVGNQSTLPVLAAAAPMALLEAIRRAAAANRWQVRTIVPALAAWLNALGQPGRRSTDRDLPHVLVAWVDDTIQVARSMGGALTTLRRVGAVELDEVLDAAGAGPGRVLVLAEPNQHAQLEQKLTAAGWQVVPAPRDANTAERAAAVLATPSDLELVPRSLEAHRAERERAWAVRAAVAAVLLFLGAAAVELWGAQRELDAVRDQRAALRSKVAPLLTSRDSLMRLEQRRDLVAGLTARSQRLTPALFDLSVLLPDETHVTSLHANGDTLLIEAEGSSAGEVLEALRSAKSLQNVRLEGMIERTLEAGATAAERFRLQARTLPVPGSAARKLPPVALPRTEAANGTR